MKAHMQHLSALSTEHSCTVRGVNITRACRVTRPQPHVATQLLLVGARALAGPGEYDVAVLTTDRAERGFHRRAVQQPDADAVCVRGAVKRLPPGTFALMAPYRPGLEDVT